MQDVTNTPDLFHLTETEFFQKLTEGKNENLHIAYRDFVLQVSEMCHNHNHKGFVISALLYAEVEIAYLQTEKMRDAVNQELAAFVTKALHFVRKTLAHYNDIKSHLVPEPMQMPEIGLNWTANKTALIELGYAFKVAKCFGSNISAKEIVSKLAKLFNVDMTENYIYKKYNEMRVRGRNSRAYFMDTLSSSLNDFMSYQDEED